MRKFRLWITDANDSCPNPEKDCVKFVEWCEQNNVDFYDYIVPLDVEDNFVLSKAKSELYQIAFRDGWDGTGQYFSKVVRFEDI